MSEITTAARPYARAVFETAQQKGDLGAWSKQLAFMAAVAHNAEMRAVLDSPRLTKEQRADLFNQVCKGQVSEGGKNLVRLLAENDRLAALPEIAALYELHRAEAEGSVEALVTSAFALTDAQQAALSASLKKRLGRDVRLVCETDEALLGGAVIRVGDMVIDGSIRGRLERIATSLSR